MRLRLLCAALLLGALPARADVIGQPVDRFASEAQMKASLREIELVDESGAQLDLAGLLRNGKPTLVTLWAHWCPNCRAELKGFKTLGEKCPTRWNVVFVSSRASDYAKDLSQFRRFGLPWRLYRTAPQMAASVEKARVLRAFSGATTRGEVITPLHYLLNERGEVRQIVNARMELSDPQRVAAFCAD
jgi:thiol-disulfide isomerase/thioredoxin